MNHGGRWGGRRGGERGDGGGICHDSWRLSMGRVSFCYSIAVRTRRREVGARAAPSSVVAGGWRPPATTEEGAAEVLCGGAKRMRILVPGMNVHRGQDAVFLGRSFPGAEVVGLEHSAIDCSAVEAFWEFWVRERAERNHKDETDKVYERLTKMQRAAAAPAFLRTNNVRFVAGDFFGIGAEGPLVEASDEQLMDGAVEQAVVAGGKRNNEGTTIIPGEREKNTVSSSHFQVGDVVHHDVQERSTAGRSSSSDVFAAPVANTIDLVWDCAFLSALEPHLRPRWAKKYSELMRPDTGELWVCVFPIWPADQNVTVFREVGVCGPNSMISGPVLGTREKDLYAGPPAGREPATDHGGEEGERVGDGPPYELSFALLRDLLEPLGFECVRRFRSDRGEVDRHSCEGVGCWTDPNTEVCCWRLEKAGTA